MRGVWIFLGGFLFASGMAIGLTQQIVIHTPLIDIPIPAAVACVGLAIVMLIFGALSPNGAPNYITKNYYDNEEDE